MRLHVIDGESVTLSWQTSCGFYLNKGSHEEEDRDDFDMRTVRLVVNTLVALDQAA